MSQRTLTQVISGMMVATGIIACVCVCVCVLGFFCVCVRARMRVYACALELGSWLRLGFSTLGRHPELD